MKGKINYPFRDKIIKILPKGVADPGPKETLGNDSLEFLSKFVDYLTNVLYVEFNAKILVAVSGGLDSVSLLDAFVNVWRKFAIEIGVAHFNHKLRGKEADEDEEFVRLLAEKYNLAFFLQRTNVRNFATKMSLSIEEAARYLRYDFFRRAAQSFSAKFIATAHNLNDQAETVLLNLLRGTGIAGLRGIANKLEISKNILIIRPFIIFTRKEIEEYAKSRGLKWREDSTNNLLEFTRNNIRHKLLPLLEREFNPQIVFNLGKLSLIAKDSYKIVSNFVKKYLEHLLIIRNKNEIELDLDQLRFYDDSLFGDMFQYIMNTYFDTCLNFRQIDEIKNLINAETGKYFRISSEIFIYKNRRKLCFIRKEKDSSKKRVIIFPKIGHGFWKNYFIESEEVSLAEFRVDNDRNVEFFDYDKIGEEFVVRNWEEGDKFVPLGMQAYKKLSDFFVDEKIPLFKKEEIPIFLTNNEIFWVGGIRISERFKVAKKTKRILKIKILSLK